MAMLNNQMVTSFTQLDFKWLTHPPIEKSGDLNTFRTSHSVGYFFPSCSTSS